MNIVWIKVGRMHVALVSSMEMKFVMEGLQDFLEIEICVQK